MRLTYDTEVDALTIEVTREAVERTEDAGEGRYIDFDDEGNIVALEILDASHGFDLMDLIERYPLRRRGSALVQIHRPRDVGESRYLSQEMARHLLSLLRLFGV